MNRWTCTAVVLAFGLGCISVSAGHPSGGYEVVSMTVAPADGPSHTVLEAGRFEFGSLGNLDDPLYEDAGELQDCEGGDSGLACFGDAVSIIAYDWVDGGLVPLWAPERVVFRLPEWNGENDRFMGQIPVGNLSCELTRESKRPTVFVGKGCAGPDGGPFEVELVMDR